MINDTQTIKREPFTPEARQLKNNEKLDINGNDFIYIAPKYLHSNAVYTYFQKSLLNVPKQNAWTDEEHMLRVMLEFKSDFKAMEKLMLCLGECYLNKFKIKDTEDNELEPKLIDLIVLQMLYSIITTYNDFTEAQSGE